MGVKADDLVFVQGMDDTKATLRRWQDRPLKPLLPWVGLSAVTAVGLLVATWAVAALSTGDPAPLRMPVFGSIPDARDFAMILYRNSLVLALHAMACVAGFMAGSSLPLSAANRSGVDRWVHEHAGRFAILFVGCATVFSLATQAYGIGGLAASVALQLDISPALLMVGLLPHALPELTALFLPLAAWLIASRRGRWEELLAATVVTTAIAIPVLLASAAVELWVSPLLLRSLAGI